MDVQLEALGRRRERSDLEEHSHRRFQWKGLHQNIERGGQHLGNKDDHPVEYPGNS